ncbi:MAG TPA: peptidylprolyl isomerase [Blastocatellia bacterium]|nr:peptidylprolyl isomerase [Blastocatellia bacterium]
MGKQKGNSKKHTRGTHIANRQRVSITRTRKGKLAIAVLLAGLIAVAMAAIRRPASGAGEPPVVATVDGVGIPSKLYRMYLKNGIEGLGLDAAADSGSKVDRLKEGIISELIDRQLVGSEAQRRGLVVPAVQLEKEYSDSVAQMGGELKFKASLSEQGMTDEEFRRNLSQEICGKLMREALAKEVDVSEDEVRDFYNRERNNPALAELFIEPERVRASHILIAARLSQISAEIQSDGNIGGPELHSRIQAEQNRRRERAARILARINNGASFEGLAREFSEDWGTRDSGGDLGLFARNTHTSQFDLAAFTIQPGKVSGIVETEFGYHIIKVTEHIPEHQRTLDEARSGLLSLLLDRKQAAHLKEWLAALRRESDIRIDPFYRVGQLLAAEQHRAR